MTTILFSHSSHVYVRMTVERYWASCIRTGTPHMMEELQSKEQSHLTGWRLAIKRTDTPHRMEDLKSNEEPHVTSDEEFVNIVRSS